MTERTMKLAMIQMRVEPGDKAANLRRASQLLADAARAGAQVALLPEALNTSWTDLRARTLADVVPDGETCSVLRQAAQAHQLHVCAGLVERDPHDRLFNSAVLVGPDGKVLLRHRKIYELEIAHEAYALGDGLAVADTKWGRIGVMICADALAPGHVISRTLGLMGAAVILSPCAWAVAADHDNAKEPYGQLWRDHYGPVARDFRLWIAGASNVGPIHTGPWAGRRCIGCSLLVGPDGQQVQGPYGEEAETLVHAELTLAPRPARGDGWERLLPGKKPVML